MSFSIKADYPDLPSGEKLTMTGLPVQLVNKRAVDMSQEEVDQYEANTGLKLSEQLKDDPYVKLTTKKSGGEK